MFPVSQPWQNLLNSLDTGVHMIDADGRSQVYNQKMSRIEGMDPGEVVSRHLLDIFQFASSTESRLLQAIHSGKTFTGMQQTYHTFKGDRITTINDIFPLYENDVCIGAVELARDITSLERMSRERRGLRWTFQDLIGQAPAFVESVHRAERAALSQSPVLITGETGTGKELIAQSIHQGSPRAGGPFIAQNCAALPASLSEQLLFGSVKGAFTDAADQPGLFEQADQGTLFLDELHTLPPALQAKLLRVLEEKRVRRLGSTKETAVDVRILAAVGGEVEELLFSGALRRDLYHRVSVVDIHLPSLRERKEDIPLLAGHFLSYYTHLFHLDIPSITQTSIHRLTRYDFPGNVRELEHLIEGAVNLAPEGRPLEVALPGSHPPPLPPVPQKDEFSPLSERMEEAEKQYLQQVLTYHGGNISASARTLGIKRQSLQYRIHKYDLRF
ncbi:sigma-54 interaction domain-containing protein [Alkalicoccus urumqiensis]|uniref:Sigma-54-dependent Fis family transcriptional regulator n=1 Tax=Alkalicoccus urumqiensis TaxID=1548213 RepID=A0A2P6MHY8_ALKUR|nr:sigma 54-interacting transcriptional regulator [Alkalicoccus urumqiensis]PRO65905.1 sigma-54-dependent Fis family transcriptional regulator [Alkalicoccus urumqiensis]